MIVIALLIATATWAHVQENAKDAGAAINRPDASGSGDGFSPAMDPQAAGAPGYDLHPAIEHPGVRDSSDGSPPAINHPAIYIVDEAGANVLLSHKPVSTMRTCGGCHDTGFIATHSYHANLGYDEMVEPGSAATGRGWDTSPGPFGRWNPLAYRYLTPNGDALLDLGTAGWIRTLGFLHAGGGPAISSLAGTPLGELDGWATGPAAGGSIDPPAGRAARNVADPETHVLDETTGTPTRWDWRESGVVEFNCFICHLAAPDNEARIRALREGRFKWAATATLGRTGLVAADGAGWRWAESAFKKDGSPAPGLVSIVPPSSKHCGQCHGLVHTANDPVVPSYVNLSGPRAYGAISAWNTETTGQIFSAQMLFRSGMNLAGKDELGRPWDIHAERLLECTHCHFAINDPAYTAKENLSRPAHLSFDGRRLDISEFLTQPDHNFAKGRSAQGTVANALDGTMRRCGNCHDALAAHGWLPYKKRHMDRLLCESCHIPLVRAAARQSTDWTVLTRNGGPRVEYRGVRGRVEDPAALVEGYRPLLLPRAPEGKEPPKLAPHNVIASWFWTHGDPPRPVRLYDLKRAFLDGDGYHPDVLSALDTNGNRSIEEFELLLDTPEKAGAVRGRLESLGLTELRIVGELQPFSLHHSVVTRAWATRDCVACHCESSVIGRQFVLASAAPGDVMPLPVGDSNAQMSGEVTIKDGLVVYIPVTMEEGFYILGHDRWKTVEKAGVIAVFGVLAGSLFHGGLRWHFGRTRRRRS